MARPSEQEIRYNDAAVAKVAKTKTDTQKQWTIAGVPGLMLVVKPSGVASWRVRYKVGKGAKQQRRTEVIGKYGVMTLAEARERALEIEKLAAKGMDAVAEAKDKENAITLRQLFEARMEKDAGTAARTLDDYRTVLERYVFPQIGNEPAGEITAERLARVLEPVSLAAPHSAHKARAALGSTYRWGMRQWTNGKRPVSLNPTVSIGFTVRSDRRKVRLTDEQMCSLWHSIDTAEGPGLAVRNIIRIAILTGQRNSEVAGMEVLELNGLDTATPRWDIPAQRMKRKTDDQHVPLSKQAVVIINEALRSNSNNGVHVFQGTTHGRNKGVWRQEHIGQETVSRAFRQIADEAGLKHVVLHDMRKCITTWLAEHGHATPEVLDAILHHERPGVTGSHYNFALYEKQVRQALQLWADFVAEVVRIVGLSGR